MKTCLVIPCYNEESRLNIEEIKKFADLDKDTHLLLVNDGSKDRTLSILKKLSSDIENIEYLDLEVNAGKAQAVRLGMLSAHKKDIFSYIGYFDADLATPFSEVENFKRIMSIESYDIVMGSRILRLGGNVDRKWYRHLLGRLFATFASISLGLPVYDTQCGAKFFKANLVEELFLEKFISYWIFDVELLFRYKKLVEKSSIYELPLDKWVDVAGSKLSPLDFLKAPMELLKIYKKYKG
ncbi:dolichyl-phosphate beta-glucosyltransferase [Halobacteriovorax sp. HLS]|uniref:dolichyl-phosphate beta-glucosyltransferase n=1 Tax=Halobacteriovorax sp. HLS TaxID=2234000 RepID=UPI000FD85344|nr:dolichyl-phosphate beta-glucosyltransferase [Halobacteriovorax sp. HLS]